MNTLLWGLFLFVPPAVVIHLISRLRPEKPRLRSTLLGMLLAFILMLFLLDPTVVYIFGSIPVGIAEALEIDPRGVWYRAFIGAGLFEETLKFLLLAAWVRFRRQMLWGDKVPDRTPLWDVLIPALWLAAGFSVVENAWYLYAGAQDESIQLLTLALWRVFLVTPGHLVYGIFMGFLYGLGLNRGPLRWLTLPGALVVPVLVHGLWDLLAFSDVPDFAMIFLLLALLYPAFRAIRSVMAQDQPPQAA